MGIWLCGHNKPVNFKEITKGIHTLWGDLLSCML